MNQARGPIRTLVFRRSLPVLQIPHLGNSVRRQPNPAQQMMAFHNSPQETPRRPYRDSQEGIFGGRIR